MSAAIAVGKVLDAVKAEIQKLENLPAEVLTDIENILGWHKESAQVTYSGNVVTGTTGAPVPVVTSGPAPTVTAAAPADGSAPLPPGLTQNLVDDAAQ